MNSKCKYTRALNGNILKTNKCTLVTFFYLFMYYLTVYNKIQFTKVH
jgi:hypothetical protein